MLAGAGYDWILFDTEHSPGDPASVLAQLQAAAPYPVSAVVRPTTNDAALIKRYLDVGAQTLLIPYGQNADEARAAVRAVTYPPDGIRGVSGWTRANRFGRVKDYARRAAEEICLLVQVETVEALGEIEAIASVDGVHGIFVGPSDLAASMGHAGQASHPEVVAAVEDAIRRIRAAGSRPASSRSTRPSPSGASRRARSSRRSAPTARSCPAEPTPCGAPSRHVERIRQHVLDDPLPV